MEDIYFLHPPTNFLKDKFPLSGVFPAESAATDYFLHAPVGISALIHRLRQNGFNVGFLNIARLFYDTIRQGKSFSLDSILKGISAPAIGIDLHWAVHSSGAIELARALKKFYPQTFIFLGGLTSTYFYREILQDYPFIDAVVLGEADESIIPLVNALRTNTSLETVPNLAYRNFLGKGKQDDIQLNRIVLPSSWENNRFPVIDTQMSCAYIAIKGCKFDCPFCGGSATSYREFFSRKEPVFLSPDRLVDEIIAFDEQGVETLFLAGDIRMMGPHYVDAFFSRLKELQNRKLTIRIQEELFYPAHSRYLDRWKQAQINCSFIFTPESADYSVRKRLGKTYSDEVLFNMVKNFSHMELPLVLCFLYALPGQDQASIHSTMDFIHQSIQYPHIDYVIEPMLFIDPGSPIFENPQKWGYHIDFHTLKDIKFHLEKPHWSQTIGYHTDSLSKEEMIEMIFYTAQYSDRIRMEQNPELSSLYLLNYQNSQKNRELINLINTSPQMTDKEIERFISQQFPPYLLLDNYIRKTQIPQQFTNQMGGYFSAFPYLNYILLYILKVSPSSILECFFNGFREINNLKEETDRTQDHFEQIQGAPIAFKKEIGRLLSEIALSPNIVDFIQNLIDFEWINYCSENIRSVNQKKNIENNLEEVQKHPDDFSKDFSKLIFLKNKNVSFKQFLYNFDTIQWKNFSFSQIRSEETSYVYFLNQGYHKTISSTLKDLAVRCGTGRSVAELIETINTHHSENQFITAINLGNMLSQGILMQAESSDEETAGIPIENFPPAEVLFIVPPGINTQIPSLGVHLLQAQCKRNNIRAHIFYANIHFSDFIGADFYNNIVDLDQTIFIAERLFASVAFQLPFLGKNVHRLIDPQFIPDHLWHSANKEASLKISEDMAPIRQWILSIDWGAVEKKILKWINYITKKITQASYPVIGCTNTLGGLVSGIALLHNIKKLSPDTLTVLGGAHCEGQMAQGILSLNNGIDYIFQGDSDKTFPEFIRNILQGKKDHPPIIHGEEVTDLDDLPPPQYDDFFQQVQQFALKYPSKTNFPIPYETSRGCRWKKCIFCGLTGERKNYHAKSPQKVLEELEQLVLRHPRSPIRMSDNLIPHTYFNTLFPSIAAKFPPLNIRYEVNASLFVNQVIALKEAGITLVQPGIESFSPSLLKRMGKYATVQGNIAFLRYCRSVGVDVLYNLLFGFPGDQESNYLEMIELIPLILHLPPPQRVLPIQIQRFNKYQEDPESYEITNLRHASVYDDIFPENSDIQKIAYYFTGDFQSKAYTHPHIIDRFRKQYFNWLSLWGGDPCVSPHINPPVLHIESMPNANFQLTDKRGLPGLSEKLVLDIDHALILMKNQLMDSDSPLMKWALEKRLAVVIDNWFIPLPTAEPSFFK